MIELTLEPPACAHPPCPFARFAIEYTPDVPVMMLMMCCSNGTGGIERAVLRAMTTTGWSLSIAAPAAPLRTGPFNPREYVIFDASIFGALVLLGRSVDVESTTGAFVLMMRSRDCTTALAIFTLSKR